MIGAFVAIGLLQAPAAAAPAGETTLADKQAWMQAHVVAPKGWFYLGGWEVGDLYYLRPGALPNQYWWMDFSYDGKSVYTKTWHRSVVLYQFDCVRGATKTLQATRFVNVDGTGESETTAEEPSWYYPLPGTYGEAGLRHFCAPEWTPPAEAAKARARKK